MKKKILFIVTLCIMLMCMLAIAVSAESVHNASTVNYDETVTLDDGTVCNLFDEDGNALIWFRNGGVLQSIRADDTEAGEDGNYVDYITPGNGYSAIANIEVHIGTKKIEVEKIVVLNLMDDDINTYFNNSTKAYETGNATFKTFVETFNSINKGTTMIEYAYLRHDTIAIGASAFAKCYKLKYVNFEDLTELTTIGPISAWDYGWAFYECKALFSGETLDLSKTKLATLNSGSTKADGHNYKARSNFYGMTMTSVILPPTLQSIGVGTFYNCTSLKTISLGARITIVDNAAFYSVPLEQIFFYGTLDEIDDLVACTSITENGAFLSAFGTNNENVYSHSEYKLLSDKEKEGKKVIYDYNFCEAYFNDTHDEDDDANCETDDKCSRCGKVITTAISHVVEKEILYLNGFIVEGKVVSSCVNDGCTYNVTENAPALFECLGYSVGPDGYSLKAGFTINIDAVKEYKELYPNFTFGAVIVNANTVSSKDAFFVNGVINPSAKGLMVCVEDLQYAILNVDISNFNASMADTLQLVVGLYTNDGEGNMTVAQYISTENYPTAKTYSDMSLNAVTLNQARLAHGMDALIPPTPNKE